MKTKQITMIYCLCTTLILAAAPALADLNDGLIAYWAFEGNAQDSSTNRIDGTVSNADFTTGHIGLGLRVRGLTNSFVEVPGNPLLSPDEEVSVSLWVKVLSPPLNAYAGFIYKPAIEPTFNNGSQDRSYTLWVDQDGRIQIASTFVGTNKQWSYDTPQGALPVGQFVHVVGIISTKSNTMTVYVNANKVLTGDYPGIKIRTGNLPLRIGAPYSTLYDQVPLDGIIDEVRIYNRALSDAEVLQLFVNGGDVNLTIAVSQVRLCWSVPSNKTAQLQFRSELTGNTWSNYGPAVLGFTNICMTDEVVVPSKFYRVIFMP